MARIDEGDIHVLDIVGRNVDQAVAGLEERIRRIEAALAASVTGVHRGVAELWRDWHAAAKPPVVVVEETTETGEGDTETASPEAAAVIDTEDKQPPATSKHGWLGQPPARTPGIKKRWI